MNIYEAAAQLLRFACRSLRQTAASEYSMEDREGIPKTAEEYDLEDSMIPGQEQI